MSNLLLNILYFLLYAILTAIFAITPYTFRRDVCFGVLIPEKMYLNSEIQLAKKQFCLFVIEVAVFMYGISCTSAIRGVGSIVLVYNVSLFALVFGVLTFYYVQYRKILSIRWRVNEITFGYEIIKKDTISIWWYLFHFGVIFVTVITPLIFYPYIPDKISMYYTNAGIPDIFTAKSKLMFLAIPVVQLFFTVAHIILFKMVNSVNVYIDVKKSIKFNYIQRTAWAVFVTVSGILFVFSMFIWQIAFMEFLKFSAAHLMFIILITVLIIYGIMQVRLLNKIKEKEKSE